MILEEEFRFLILGAQREGNRLLAERLAPLGLTPSQGEVLRCLADAGPLSLIALGGLLVCETGSPSRLISTLVEKMLVERDEDPADRRQVTLKLTAEGRRLAMKVSKVEESLHRWIRNRMGASALATSTNHMRRFLSGTRAGDAIARRKTGSEKRGIKLSAQ
jgi:DNA-binding MarR family transcriptional regulator